MQNQNADLIKKASTGDLVAYQEFVRSYSARVHAIAYQMIGNSTDAQDIAQEVFVKLYRSLGKYKSQFSFSTWLYRLTVNHSIDYMRKQSRQKTLSLDNIQENPTLKEYACLPDKAFEDNELKGVIRRISEGLTEKQRKVFVLRELQGFSTEEIAQILKCRVSTVRVHLSKARNHIKNALMKQGIPNQSGRSVREEK